jgi:hypothetical protein
MAVTSPKHAARARKNSSAEEKQWLGTTEARRLLSLGSENTVKRWAQLGFLRSRKDPNGRVKVWRADVMRHAQLTEAVGAGPEGVLSTEELVELSQARGPKPWKRG